jgi:hypothetical protein
MHALALNAAARTFSPVSGWSVNSNASGPPIYAGGLVWSASSGVGGDNGTLYGLDPATGATRFSASLGGFEHFTTPSAGGGRLFVATHTASRDGVTAFQIANAPTPTPMPPTVKSPIGKRPAPSTRPVISHLKASTVHRKLHLSFTISESARLTIAVYRRGSGRIVKRRCRIGTRHGRACTLLLRKATITVFARRGQDRIAPRMRALAPGRYVVRVIAVNATGGRSRTYTVGLTVR